LNAGTDVALNAVVTVTFSAAMAPATITTATFTLKGPGAAVVPGAVVASGVTATYTPTASLAANTTYVATVTTGAQTILGGSMAADYVWTFTTGAPTVISVTPLSGATAVPVNTLVTATFSEPMNGATLTAATFTVTGPGVTPVAGVVTYAGSTATFTPSAVLANATLFTATITTGAEDPATVPLASNFVWTFTTAAAPTVVSKVPATGAVGVAKAATVNATFSVAMNAATIDATTFLLKGPGVTPVVGVVTYAGTTATFTPNAPQLLPSTLYTATVTTGAQDTTGAPLAANVVWTFTTGPAPLVTSTFPSAAVVNVPLNQKVVATFTAPMTASTITTAGTFAVVETVGGANVPGAVTYDASSNSGVFAPTNPLTASTEYTATVTTAAKSALGFAIAADKVWDFTTGVVANTSAPRVTATIPALAATAVPINQRIAATFSLPMDPATISAAGTISVAVSGGGAAVAGTVSYAGGTAVFTPTANLAASTAYTMTITTAAKDITGVALAANYVTTFTSGTTAGAVVPTIASTNPVDTSATEPIDKTINATFSAPMDPTTITNATFTVTVAGVPISGTVVYYPDSQIASFTPSSNLAATTAYVATISTAVKDLTGIAIGAGAAANPWTFTTTGVVGTGPATLNLGAAGSAGVMAVTSIVRNTGPVLVNGDVELAPGSAQGILTPEVNGTIHINDAVVTQAQTDLLAAYNDAISRVANPTALAASIGGTTILPGLHINAGAVTTAGGNVTLDAQGDPNAIFLFKVGTTLTTVPGTQILLVNGARAGNIFWQVGTTALLDTTTLFKGSILAGADITLNAGAVVEGRVLAGASAVVAGTATVGANTAVSAPAPQGSGH
jgi:hypothetical protein